MDESRKLVKESVQGDDASAPRERRRSDDGLWDAIDVARYLKASRSWVYRQAEAGKLPCVRFVGLLRFEPKQIKALGRGEVHASKRVVAIAVGRDR